MQLEVIHTWQGANGGGDRDTDHADRPSKDAARKFFEAYPNFASWDRESLREWINGAIVTDSRDGTSAILANHPLTEAAVYSGKRLELSEAELARPKCRVHLHAGVRTRLFDVPTFQGIADRHPDIYKLYDPMSGVGHLMVFEDPETSSAAILHGLEELLDSDAVASRL
jgi:pimeloyl-ACP methyl ester carboxylesterase